MKRLVLAATLAAVVVPATARADAPDEPVQLYEGNMEVDASALVGVTRTKVGDDESFSLSAGVTAGYQYYLGDALSVGGEVLYQSDEHDKVTHAYALGAALSVTLHARLGRFAFICPSLALGGVHGTRETDLGPDFGGVVDDPQSAFVMRMHAPFAFVSKSGLLFQIGPALDLWFGSLSRKGAGSSSLSQATGGFSASIGYLFAGPT